MNIAGIFTNNPKKAMSAKDIDLQTSRLKFVAAAGSIVTVGLAIALGSLKLANELKK
jgi:hypothetical protein